VSHMISVWPDGSGFWTRIVDTRTGVVIRTTWGPGTERAAIRDARRYVESLEFVETMARTESA
jgi:hypothetical protein